MPEAWPPDSGSATLRAQTHLNPPQSLNPSDPRAVGSSSSGSRPDTGTSGDGGHGHRVLETAGGASGSTQQPYKAGTLLVPSTLAAETTEQIPHRLLHKYPFEKLRRNDKVSVQPGILHFGGFRIHKRHVQKFTVRNVSSAALRLMVLSPSSKEFKIQFDKKGLLAPGSAEEIEVYFYPKEWRYHHDVMQIFTGSADENLVVPIHGYPAANDVKLPAIVDFGTIGIARSKTKILPLSCNIPVEFEYEISILENDDAFEVTPLRGFIPADSLTNVAITYMPTSCRTNTMRIAVDIAQFDARPQLITIVGNCMSDLSKGETVVVGEREYRKVERGRAKLELENRVQTLFERKANPFVDKIFLRPDVEKYKTVDDVKIPLDEVYGQRHFNFVMNQTPGKMPLVDLADFIREQREQLNQTHAKATAGEVEEKDEDQETAQDRQAKELRFEMRFRDLEL